MCVSYGRGHATVRGVFSSSRMTFVCKTTNAKGSALVGRVSRVFDSGSGLCLTGAGPTISGLGHGIGTTGAGFVAVTDCLDHEGVRYSVLFVSRYDAMYGRSVLTVLRGRSFHLLMLIKSVFRVRSVGFKG